MLPLRSRILAKVISIVRVLNQGHIFHATTNAEHKYGKMKTENEPAMGHSRVLQCGYLLSHPLCYIQLLLKRALIFHIPIHKASEQPWRHVTSLKLCKCSQISHPSPKVALTSCRWHMLRFDTGLEGGKPFLPVSKLLGLTYVICCNQGLFFQIVLCLGIIISQNALFRSSHPEVFICCMFSEHISLRTPLGDCF